MRAFVIHRLLLLYSYRVSLEETKDDKELQKNRKIEFLKIVNSELSRNIFFEKYEIRVIIEELSKMESK